MNKVFTAIGNVNWRFWLMIIPFVVTFPLAIVFSPISELNAWIWGWMNE